jgi:hypothetical protein
MGEEHDAWFKKALGVDVRESLRRIESAGSSAIRQVASPEAKPAVPAQRLASTDGPESTPTSSPGVLNRLGKAVSTAGGTARGAASKALDTGKTASKVAGKAVIRAQSAAWDGTKSAYGAVTGAYDSVAPNLTKSNKALGDLVDAGEAAAKKGNKRNAAKYASVPLVGSVVKASALVGNASTDAVGGVVKGVGDLATMSGNAIVHPIDAAKSLAEGALGITEHVPIAPGLNTAVKGVHGLVDLGQGKKDGEYGGSLGDLGKNLLLDTKQDPNNPGKRTSADIDFVADIGGGTKAWKEKPVEAATRTITNLAPMLLGDEGLGGKKPQPNGRPPVPEGGPVDPVGKTPANPLAKTQPGVAVEKTPVNPLAKSQPGVPVDGSPNQVDPAKPGLEPDAPKANPSQTPEQIRQNLIDATAAQEVTQRASAKATGEYVRYRQNMPDPARGFAGDPSKWDPVVDEALLEQTNRAEQANIEAINNLKAAQEADRDALPGAKKRRGGSPPGRS